MSTKNQINVFMEKFNTVSGMWHIEECGGNRREYYVLKYGPKFAEKVKQKISKWQSKVDT